MIYVYVLIAYLIGGRTTFWILTKEDWPKSQSWSCGQCSSEYHHHAYNGCTQHRDLAKSRRWRVALAYLWWIVLPALICFYVVGGTALVVHKIITEPITTPAERRERRLNLERQVAAAEAEDEKAKALQTAASVQAAPGTWECAAKNEPRREPGEVSAKRRFPIPETSPLGGWGA